MRSLSVFIADAERLHVARVRDALERSRELTLAGAAADGREAYAYLLGHPVDVVLTDLQLPGMDGSALMRALRRTSRAPLCIVCTRFYSDFSVETACRCGAAYFLYKPLDADRLPELILDCWKERSRTRTAEQSEPPAARARRLLTGLGFPSRLAGTAYLNRALQALSDDRADLRNLSKGLYADIAAATGTRPACVERCIRTAVSIAFTRGTLSQHFDHCPSNRAMIERLLEMMEEGEDGV